MTNHCFPNCSAVIGATVNGNIALYQSVGSISIGLPSVSISLLYITLCRRRLAGDCSVIPVTCSVLGRYQKYSLLFKNFITS